MDFGPTTVIRLETVTTAGRIGSISKVFWALIPVARKRVQRSGSASERTWVQQGERLTQKDKGTGHLGFILSSD